MIKLPKYTLSVSLALIRITEMLLIKMFFLLKLSQFKFNIKISKSIPAES